MNVAANGRMLPVAARLVTSTVTRPPLLGITLLFAKAHGPLRAVVERVLRGFLKCGLAEHGFARAEWQTCRASYLVPFSCRGRNFCPSCEKKKQLLWAEWLQEEVQPVPHRHVVLTMPRLLRGIFRKRRELLLDLSQASRRSSAARRATTCGR